MARSFDGRFSEELYNPELHKLFEVMQHIVDIPEDVNVGPITSRNGALWLDRTNGGDLKFKNNGSWETVYNDKFRMICEILSPEEPSTPVSGQLWLNDGILMYFSGSEWLPVKSVNVAAEFNLSAFEQFLIISPIPAAGKLVVDEVSTNSGEIKKLYIEEEFTNTSGQSTFVLTKGTYTMDNNCVNVYIDGRRMASTAYKEVNNKTVQLHTALTSNQQVLIEYINLSSLKDIVNQPAKTALEVSQTNTQFLVPSTELDRFFIDGMFSHDYKEISDVAIEYPTLGLQGKNASAVHINPKKLTGTRKRLFAIDKNNPVIPVAEMNTEYYGYYKGVGKLLLKGKHAPDYTSVAQGIKLSTFAANTYDFVVAITYEFKNVKGNGSMTKGQLKLSETTSVWVGEVDDPLCVFVQGMYLDENIKNYVYEDGYVKFKLQTKMDLGIVAFPKKEIGEITSLNNKKQGIINVNGAYRRRLVFVYGENVEHTLADYVVDPTNPKKLYVNNARVGMKYTVVETEVVEPAEQMFFKSGVIEKDIYTNDFYIPIKPGEITETDSVILFVNGLLIMKSDVIIDSANNRIDIVGGFKEGLEYVLLKDEYGRYIFSDYVSFNTIPLGHKSDMSLVYIENQLASDAGAVYVTKLPGRGYVGEVKQLLTNETSDWYKCTATQGWQKITDELTIRMLNDSALGYSVDGSTINILQNFGKKDAVFYSYRYANSVDEPLLRGVIKTLKDKDSYKTAFNHSFKGNTNALSVWQNGLRQNHDTTGDIENLNGYMETGKTEFIVPKFWDAHDGHGDETECLPNEGKKVYLDGIMFYVVERPEGTEYKSCERQILTTANIIEGTKNQYRTDIPLWPGNVRVFISGLRQPDSAYRITDNYILTLNEEILCSPSNFPIEDVHLNENDSVEIERVHPDQILIEVRQDLILKEITLPVRYSGQREWSISPKNPDDITKGGDALPESVIDSKDFIMIYVNGMAYGKDYRIDKDNGTIMLTNDTITNMLGKDPIYEYFQANPNAYQNWRIENNGAVYTAKTITDKITFEWR